MCGVFGIYGHPQSKKLVLMALAMLGHRGQSATGFAGFTNLNPLTLEVVKGHGTVDQVLSEEKLKRKELLNDICIGHTRWPTQKPGNHSSRQIQPHYSQTQRGRIAIASNGDIVNMDEQREFLESRGIRLYTENDAEVIAASIVYQMTERKRNEVESIFQVMDHVRGAYSSVMMTEFGRRLYAFRDPLGIRPLIFAEINQNGLVYYVVTSEDCVINNLIKQEAGAYIIEEREVRPGEIIKIENGKTESFMYSRIGSCPRHSCIFEYVYFARPDSRDERGRTFNYYREEMGRELAREHPIDNDENTIVIPVPEGGIPSAIGYAEVLDLPLKYGIVIERSYGRKRTFIEMDPGRQVALKYHVLVDVVKGKRVVIVDDSIVRSTTSSRLLQMLRAAGAKEVHFRIPSPPYCHPCDLGVETRDPERLVASRAGGDVERIRIEIGGADSLGYLSLKGLYRAIGKKGGCCDHCFSGCHPLNAS